MFQGAISLSLDAKGRVAIPSRHRDALVPEASPLVMTAHPDKCVLIYPQSTWEPIRKKITEMPGFSKSVATLKRLLVGYAQEETLDASGRVLVAPSLRKWGLFDKNLFLVGQGTHFELWSEQLWAEQQENMLNINMEDFSEDFGSFVL